MKQKNGYVMSRHKILVGLVIFSAIGFALFGFVVFKGPNSDEFDVVDADPPILQETTGADLWIRPVPDLLWSQWHELPEDRFTYVPTKSQQEAIRLLDEVSIVELNDEDLKRFAPTPQFRPTGSKPYLVRGVFLHAGNGRPMGTGKFKILVRDKEVAVYFGCLGRIRPEFGKGPFVVWLHFKPENVFVFCDMAE
jgi:hypothetical protein